MRRNNKAQLILMSGVLISASIVIMAIISINLANTGVKLSFEKGLSPLDEYKNLREVFINVFNQSCKGDIELINQAFNYTKNTLSNIEMKYGNYLNAKIKNIQSTKDGVNVVFNLKLICKKTIIEEDIKVYIPTTGG